VAVVVRVAAAFAAHACTAYRAVPPGARLSTLDKVRVRFAESRDVPAVARAGDTVRLSAVTRVGGEVASQRGDTLVLRVRDVRPVPAGRLVPAAGSRAVVVRSAGDRIEVRRLSVGRTIGAVVGGAALAFALALAYVVASGGIDPLGGM
jgi:hypothetical protein